MQRRFDYLKFSLLLALVFNFELESPNNVQNQIFYRDLEFCNSCFENQKTSCEKFFMEIEADTAPNKIQNLLMLWPFSSRRLMKFWKLKISPKLETKIISNSVTDTELQLFVQKYENQENLKTKFFTNENLDGLQLCTPTAALRFQHFLEKETQRSELSIWLHLMLNPEVLLMPLLESKGLPVPKTYAVCGLTSFQAYAGKAFIHFYRVENFMLKLKMAKQLLEAVLKFSNGINGFRIYITDLSADNIVWHEHEERVYFVDLNTVLIVDSKTDEISQQIHKHNYIDCKNCFAYSQQDICEHQLSDINIFAACQLLREDLSRNHEAGFLYPIPATILNRHPQFTELLDECVDCVRDECLHRFPVAAQLIQLFEHILMEQF